MKIEEINGEMDKVNLEGTIVKVGKIRKFTNKFGRKVEVVDVTITDGTGEITLTLFGKLAYLAKKGKSVKISNGYTKFYRDKLHLYVGKEGKIVIS